MKHRTETLNELVAREFSILQLPNLAPAPACRRRPAILFAVGAPMGRPGKAYRAVTPWLNSIGELHNYCRTNRTEILKKS